MRCKYFGREFVAILLKINLVLCVAEMGFHSCSFLYPGEIKLIIEIDLYELTRYFYYPLVLILR